LPVLIPFPSGLNISERVWVNGELVGHLPKRALRRASASAQGIDFSGC
jgi:hypothetical protein